MKRSTDRVLTTHVGRLPRLADLPELMQVQASGKADATAVERCAAGHQRHCRAAGRNGNRRSAASNDHGYIGLQ